MKIRWSKNGLKRFQECIDFIAQDKPAAAVSWGDTWVSKVSTLADYPKLGRIVPEVNRKDIREIIFANYRLIYKIEQNQIVILTIRSTRQKK